MSHFRPGKPLNERAYAINVVTKILKNVPSNVIYVETPKLLTNVAVEKIYLYASNVKPDGITLLLEEKEAITTYINGPIQTIENIARNT